MVRSNGARTIIRSFGLGGHYACGSITLRGGSSDGSSQEGRRWRRSRFRGQVGNENCVSIELIRLIYRYSIRFGYIPASSRVGIGSFPTFGYLYDFYTATYYRIYYSFYSVGINVFNDTAKFLVFLLNRGF